MDEMRIKKIEFGMAELKRRVSDHDALHAESRKDIAMLQSIADSNQKILEKMNDTSISHKEILDKLQSLDDWAKKTYEVFEPLARFGVRIAKYGAIFVAAWHAVKWAWAKFLVVT
jgi:hypothetical protein